MTTNIFLAITGTQVARAAFSAADWPAQRLLANHRHAGLSSGAVRHCTNPGNHWQPLPSRPGGIHRTLILL